MGTYKVDSNGNAPSGLSIGDRIVTNGGLYEIVPAGVMAQAITRTRVIIPCLLIKTSM